MLLNTERPIKSLLLFLWLCRLIYFRMSNDTSYFYMVVQDREIEIKASFFKPTTGKRWFAVIIERLANH